MLCREAQELSRQEQKEQREQASYDKAMQAKAQVRAFKRVQLDGSAQPAAGLPVEVWACILAALFDGNPLWDLSFVRDMCNAGMPRLVG